MRKKLKVGDKLWLVNEGVNVSKKQQPPPLMMYCTITKVGRKYFTIDFRNITFHLSTWFEKTDYQSRWSLYESRQDYLDKKLSQTYYSVFKEVFSSFRIKDFSLEQYKAAAKIFGLKVED